MPLHGLSDQFLNAVAMGGRWRIKIEVRTAFNATLVADITDHVTSGSVTVDETAEIRRTIQMVLDGTLSLVPPQHLSHNALDVADMLHPAKGNELWVYRGVQFSEDPEDVEYAQLGVFRMSKPQITDDGANVTITINGSDRASVLQRQDWQFPYTVGPGANIFGVVEGAISYLMLGGNPPNVSPTDPTPLPRRPQIYDPSTIGFLWELDGMDAPYPFIQRFSYPVTTFGSDPSSAGDPMQDLITFVAAAGAELFFDVHGNVVVRPIQNPASIGIADTIHFVEGENCTMDQISRTLDETTAHNGVTLYCNGTGQALPFVVRIWDTDATSPTYYQGPWGQVPYKMVTTLIPSGADSVDLSYAKATHMAQQQLQLLLGSFDNVSINCVPNPALREGDICHVTRARMQVDDPYVISSMTIPLDPQSNMSITFRPRIQVS